MEWYYVEKGKRIGPVSEADLQGLIGVGTVTDETLVWNEGMKEWLPYAQAKDNPPVPATEAVSAEAPADVAAPVGDTRPSVNKGIDHVRQERMRYVLKEMSLADILDVASQLLKNHFRTLFTISCYMSIPVGLLHGLTMYWLMPQAGSQTAPADLAANLVPIMVVNLIFVFVIIVVVQPITNAATISAIASEYLGAPLTHGKAVKYAFQKFWPILLTTILAMLFIMAGFVCLIIPSIILAFRFWFTTHVVVIEGQSGWAALKRSHALMKGNMGKAFVLGLLLFIIAMMVESGSAFIPVQIVAVVVGLVLRTAVFIFGAAAGVAFYFSSRCQHENFDITVLAESIGKEDAVEAGADATT